MRNKNPKLRTHRVTSRFARPALTALSMAVATASHAQFFSSTGDNVSFPINLFPINGAVQTLDFTGNTVSIGNGGSGSFVATNGGLLLSDKLILGSSGTGVGGMTVTGSGTQILLGGSSAVPSTRFAVGDWGIGSLSVIGGGVVDASINAAGCTVAAACNTFIGNGAGTSAVLNISGAGSTVSTIGFTGIGNSAVFTIANDGFNFGTPGGISNGAVNVTGGGRFNTQQASVGIGPSTTSALGTEQGIGSVVVDGVGSQWVISRNELTTNNAVASIGDRAGGNGTLVIRNGGQVLMNGAGGSSSGFDVLNIGASGGTGTATVTGAGSNLTLVGNNPVLQVGGSGTSSGSLSILAGGSANSLFLNVAGSSGANSATGTVLINGAGSTMTLSGVGAPGVTGSAFANIGRTGGSGSVTISGGGQLLITDGGLDTRLGTGSPGFQVGDRAGSTGSLTITGPGSQLRVVSTSQSPTTGIADNFNPFAAVGREGGTGTLLVSAGGKLVVEGNAISSATTPRTTYFGIGGSSDTDSGSGTVTVTGAGSEIRMTGADAFLTVGRGTGSGSLTVSNGATVTSTLLAVGRAGTGNLLVDNGTINLSGQFTSDTITGAVLNFGQRGGTGTGTITNGSVVNLTNLGTNGASVNLGGTGPNPLGAGTLTLSGGSQININAASGLATFSVGRDGTGTASIIQGSTVNIGDGTVYVGRLAGGQGTLAVNGGSKVLAGQFGVGGASDTVAGGNGVATVSGPGSELRASGPVGFIGIGINGTGTLTASNQAQVNAIVLSVGRSGGNGTLTVNNGQINLAGQQTSGLFAGATLNVGIGGATGTANITNNSVINITNTGSAGAAIYVGGSANFPTGTGTLNVTNSQINITAAQSGTVGVPGLATVRIGHDGVGTATLTNSSLNLSNGATRDGTVIIAGLPGSVGTLVLNGGSVVNASYVGIGATPNANHTVQNPGGAGHLVLNDSTVNTDVFEIGAQGILSGNNGVINATGDVIVGGTIDPGNSAGRIRINCNLISLAGSKLILEVDSNGAGGFNTDILVIDSHSTFDFSNFDIVFRFIGDTDAAAFAATAGAFDLDRFIRTGVGTDETQGLSTAFASAGLTWADVIDVTKITFESAAFTFGGFSVDSATGQVTVAAARIPEPATWLLVLAALAMLRAVSRGKQVASAAIRH